MRYGYCLCDRYGYGAGGAADLERDYAFVTAQHRLARTMHTAAVAAAAAAADATGGGDGGAGVQSGGDVVVGGGGVNGAGGHAAGTGGAIATTVPTAAGTTTSTATATTTTAARTAAAKIPLNRLRCADPWQKCQGIFSFFDRDRDGLLNYEEMKRYTAVTEGVAGSSGSGGDDDDAGAAVGGGTGAGRTSSSTAGGNGAGTLLRSTWDTLCRRKGVDPELGFACEDLFKIYHVAVDKDIAKVFPGSKGAGTTAVVAAVPAASSSSSSSSSAASSSRLLHAEMDLHAKVHRIFEHFDVDRDNSMNLGEMNAFTAVTEGEQEQLTRAEWEHTCRRMLIDPDIGLAFNDLATIYTAHLDKDFETVMVAEAQRRARRRRAREKARQKKETQEREDQWRADLKLNHGLLP